MTDAGVTWWADYGTLLGAVRNPLTAWADYPWLNVEGVEPIPAGIIPHDKDGDLGALYSDYHKVVRLIPAFKKLGYSVLKRPGGSMIKVMLSPKNFTNVDIFFWRQRGKELYRVRYIQVDNFKGRNFKTTDLFPLSTVEWEGLALPAPSDPKAFCEFRYGKSWMTPVCANHDGQRR